jgi:hypothetical protein
MRFGGAGRLVAIFQKVFPVAVGVVTLAGKHRNTFVAQQRQSFFAV